MKSASSTEEVYTDESGNFWTLEELIADLEQGGNLYLTPKMCKDLAKHLRSHGPGMPQPDAAPQQGPATAMPGWDADSAGASPLPTRSSSNPAGDAAPDLKESLDFNRLYSGDYRALYPEHQPHFDAYYRLVALHRWLTITRPYVLDDFDSSSFATGTPQEKKT